MELPVASRKKLPIDQTLRLSPYERRFEFSLRYTCAHLFVRTHIDTIIGALNVVCATLDRIYIAFTMNYQLVIKSPWISIMT